MLALSVALTAACAAPPGATPSPSSDIGPVTYTLCPPSGELPHADVNAAAVAVVEARLRALGIEDAQVSVGTCLDVTIAGRPEDESLRAVLFGTGLAEIVAVPVERAGEVVSGLAPPDGLTTVLDGAAIAGATPDAGAVDVLLGEPGAAALATWTTSHAGEALALVLDGRVVGSVPIDGPDASGALRVPVPAEAGLTPEAVAALLAAGPLPGDWRQPDAPQG